MKRIGLSLLVAYAATISVVAVWFGCRAYVLQRLLARSQIVSSSASFEDVLVDTGMARTMAGPVETVIVGLAGIHTAQVAAVAGFTLLSSLILFASRSDSPKPSSRTSSKD